MNVKLLTEHNLEFLSFKRGSSESTLVKMPHCWKITCHGSYTLSAGKLLMKDLQEQCDLMYECFDMPERLYIIYREMKP